MSLQFLHTMIRISDPDASLKFFCDGLGMELVRKVDIEAGRFSLYFLATAKDIERMGGLGDEPNPTAMDIPMIELTHNWDEEDYQGGRNFGHLAYRTPNIYETVEHLAEMGVTINRPPRDGRMAFIRSPDGISVELLQDGDALAPKEPWASAENIGSW